MERDSVVDVDVAEARPPASDAELDCFPTLQRKMKLL